MRSLLRPRRSAFREVRHDPRFPREAINYCLEEAFIEPAALDAVVFYDSPLLTLDRVLRNCLHAGSEAAAQFEQAARSFLGVKMFVEDYVLESLGTVGRSGRVPLYRTPLCSRSIGILSVTFQGCCCAQFGWRR